jgi:uncharacterized protein (TIGR03435 family)
VTGASYFVSGGSEAHERVTAVYCSRRVLILAASVALAGATLALGPKSAPAAEAQDASAEAAPPQFDVVSLRKIPDTDAKWGGMQHTPGFIQTPRDSLLDLVELAYDVQVEQIVGAPSWAHSVRYKIVLSAPESTFVGPFHGEAQALRMVQTLLFDRFKLVCHRETRTLTAGALVVGPAGIKMKHSHSGRPGDWLGIDLAPGRLVGQGAPMARLTRIIALSTGQPVVDKTGLTGTYDFDAQWRANEGNLSSHQWHYVGGNPPSPAAMNAVSSSFEDALEGQLGLTLEPPQNTSEEFIVIDHVEQPSET